MSEPSARSAYPTLAGSVSRHWRVLVAVALGLASLLGLLAFVTTPPATAQGRLGLTFPAPGNVLLPVPTGDLSLRRYVAQRAEFAESDAVVGQVADETGLSDDQIRARLTVEPTAASNGLDIVAEGDSAGGAAALVSAVMVAYRDQTLAETTRRSQTLAQAQADSGLPNTAQRTLADLEVFGDGVEFATSPSADTTHTRGLPWRAVLMGLLAGLGLGGLLMWTLDLVEHRRNSLAEGATEA